MKIGLTYGHVASNIGDICINQGIVNILEQIDSQIELYVIIRNPNKVYLESSIESFNSNISIEFKYLQTPKNEQENIDILNYYISKPEEFLKDTGLTDVDVILNNSGEFIFAYKNDPRTDLLWRLLPLLAAKKVGKKFVTFPSTLGPFDDYTSTKLINEFLIKQDRFFVRETASKKITENLIQQKVTELLDPAFFIKEKSSKKNTEEFSFIMRLDDFGLRIGGRESSTNYRQFKETGFEETLAFKFTYRTIKKIIAEYNHPKIRIFIQTRYDEDLAYKLKDKLISEKYDDIVTIEKPISIEDYIDKLSTSSYVISSRFHGCILALLANTMPMGVYFESHGHKIPGLYNMLNIDEYCELINDDNIDIAVNTTLAKFIDRERALDEAKTNISSYKDKTIKSLAEAIANGESYSENLPNVLLYKDFVNHLINNRIKEDQENLISENKILKREMHDIKKISGDLKANNKEYSKE